MQPKLSGAITWWLGVLLTLKTAEKNIKHHTYNIFPQKNWGKKCRKNIWCTIARGGYAQKTAQYTAGVYMYSIKCMEILIYRTMYVNYHVFTAL